MIARFSEIRTEIMTALGLISTTIQAVHTTSINLRINQIQDMIFFDRQWAWRKRAFYFTTIDDYSTGTVAVTQNSRTVTGTNTVWTTAMGESGLIRINGRWYKIDRVASSTSLILAAPYPDATESSASYNIGFPYIHFPVTFSAIASLIHEGRELELIPRLSVPADDDLGSPIAASLTERSVDNFYTTGTASVTQDSASVTGTTTTWLALMEGMSFRVAGTSEFYVVRERTSNTAITLDRPYQGATNATATYVIGHRGSQLITISHIPDDYYFIKGEGLIAPVPLVLDADLSLIPNHDPLLKGAMWLCMHDLENANPVRVQQAKSEFDKSMKQLYEQYRTISNVRWISEAELKYRRVGGTQVFNPLSRTGY